MFIASCWDLRSPDNRLSPVKVGQMLRRTTAELVLLAGVDDDFSSVVQRHLEHRYRVDGIESTGNVPMSVISAHPLEDNGGHRIVAGALLHVTVRLPAGPVSVVAADLVETIETTEPEVHQIWDLLRSQRRGILAGSLGFNPARPDGVFAPLARELVLGHGTWVRHPDTRPVRGVLLHHLEARGGGTYRPDGAEIHWARVA